MGLLFMQQLCKIVMITNINELAKYSKNKIEIVKELHRDKAVEVLKMRGQ